jgi:hypothetical protein
MLKFYYSGAPNPTKVALFLEEAGLPYEAIPVDTRKGDQHKADYLAINPNAKVPAIVDGDVTVFDSSAILVYLAEKTGKFLPAKTDKARGELLSWMFFVSSGVGPYSGQSVHFRAYAPEKLPYAINRYAYEAQRQLHHRRHERVGLGAADPEHPGRGRLGQVPESQTHGRRGHRAARGAEGHDAEGPPPVQGRDGRRRQEGDVRASDREGCVERKRPVLRPRYRIKKPRLGGASFW